MKSYAILILATSLFMGCSSSKKKSNDTEAAQNSESVSESTPAVQDSVLVTQPYSLEADTSELTSFSGQFNYTGNEPFTEAALFISDGGPTYRLTADETFMEETFDSLSGKTVTVYGKMIESENSTLLEVHYYELIEN